VSGYIITHCERVGDMAASVMKILSIL
jgi:hypothetical protein